ncbi:hypothetical protein F4815DRAFT_495410 [Daldinia loculata]|nr:hypothetical protein F4815DRAFT_495410 [Daldinia loculata]
MFIYAKLVLQMVKDQGTLYDIEMQMENLPDGLDQALGLTNRDGFSISDPLQIFLARRRLRQAIESMICQGPNHIPDCLCDHLKHLYGTKIYHCDQYFCYAYQSGFESKQARDRHLEIHKRSHKCPVENCLFSEIGFHDATEFDRHTRAAHPSGTLERNHAGPGALPIQPAVVLDQRQIFEEMLIGVQETTFSKYTWDRLICEASSKASSNTFSCLLDQPWLDLSKYPLALTAALEAENVPNIKLLLSHGLNMSETSPSLYEVDAFESVRKPLARQPKLSGYIHALRTWNPKLITCLIHECQVEFPEQIDEPGMIFSSPRIGLYTPDEAMGRFNEIKQYIIWPEAYVRGVRQAVESGCAVAVRICLENGGNPNKGRSLLFHAIYIGNENGAEVEELDLHMKGMRKGMATIEKCFGCGWEEVVRRIQAGEDLAITPSRRKKRA